MWWQSLINLLSIILTSEAHSPEVKAAATQHALNIAGTVLGAAGGIASAAAETGPSKASDIVKAAAGAAVDITEAATGAVGEAEHVGLQTAAEPLPGLVNMG